MVNQPNPSLENRKRQMENVPVKSSKIPMGIVAFYPPKFPILSDGLLAPLPSAS
jgi:hypothetical protein